MTIKGFHIEPDSVDLSRRNMELLKAENSAIQQLSNSILRLTIDYSNLEYLYNNLVYLESSLVTRLEEYDRKCIRNKIMEIENPSQLSQFKRLCSYELGEIGRTHGVGNIFHGMDWRRYYKRLYFNSKSLVKFHYKLHIPRRILKGNKNWTD